MDHEEYLRQRERIRQMTTKLLDVVEKEFGATMLHCVLESVDGHIKTLRQRDLEIAILQEIP
jgi:hypothetical protein